MAGCLCGRVAAKRVQYLLQWSFLTFSVCESGWQFECGERESARARERERQWQHANAKTATTQANCVSEDGSLVEHSLYNEIKHPFPANEANLEHSRPSSGSPHISPRCSDRTDKTEPGSSNCFCVTKQKLGHGDDGIFFPSAAFFWRAHTPREREPETATAAQHQEFVTAHAGGARTDKPNRSRCRVTCFKCSCWQPPNKAQL